MRIKRFLALVLACALTAGLLILPSSAARQPSAFPDITDEATAEAAEILRLLGIVSGTGSGNFEPGRTLTRAEFCKMAVEIMGNGDKVAAQMNRTVFADVPSTHWARGYVAVATQGSSSGSGESAVSTPGIIRGDATGRFHPDRATHYGTVPGSFGKDRIRCAVFRPVVGFRIPGPVYHAHCVRHKPAGGFPQG